MPRISEFYGVVIAMFYDDHGPPHFHAYYGEHMALIGIGPVRVVRGWLPRRAQSLIFEWAAIHQEELVRNWERARAKELLVKIEPLD
jgi:hypothetical protein